MENRPPSILPLFTLGEVDEEIGCTPHGARKRDRGINLRKEEMFKVLLQGSLKKLLNLQQLPKHQCIRSMVQFSIPWYHCTFVTNVDHELRWHIQNKPDLTLRVYVSLQVLSLCCAFLERKWKTRGKSPAQETNLVVTNFFFHTFLHLVNNSQCKHIAGKEISARVYIFKCEVHNFKCDRHCIKRKHRLLGIMQW